MALITAGSSAARFSESMPLGLCASIGNPSRPTTTTASTPSRRPNASTSSRMVATAAKLGRAAVEVKHSPWVDPLPALAVSSLQLMRARRLSLVVPVVAAALAAQAACGTSTGLPIATQENSVDTVILFALDGTPVYTPSAYDLSDKSKVRTDRSTVGFDFAFNITPAGQAELLSTGAMSLGKSSGFIIKGDPFDAIAQAPSSGYQDSVAVPIDSGSVFIVRSRPSVNCAAIGLSLP